MAKARDKWSDWYRRKIDAWWSSAEVQALSYAGQVAFLALCDYQFQREDGTIPNDERTLRIQSRVRPDDWELCKDQVIALFEPMPNGKLANMTMYEEWKRSRDEWNAHQERSKRGADAKWQKSSNAQPMPKQCLTNAEPMQKDAKRREETRREETVTTEVADDEKLGAVLERIACAHPKSREKGWTALDVTPAAIAAVMDAIGRESTVCGVPSLEVAHQILAWTCEIARRTPPQQVRFVPNVERFFRESEYRSPADKWSGNAATGNGGAGRSKSDRNLAALREVTGSLPAMDQRAAHRDSECSPGDDFGSGSAPVLEGNGGLPPTGYRNSGGASLPNTT